MEQELQLSLKNFFRGNCRVRKCACFDAQKEGSRLSKAGMKNQLPGDVTGHLMRCRPNLFRFSIFFFFFDFFRRSRTSNGGLQPPNRRISRKLSIVSGGSIYYSFDEDEATNSEARVGQLSSATNSGAFSTSHQMVTLGTR